MGPHRAPGCSLFQRRRGFSEHAILLWRHWHRFRVSRASDAGRERERERHCNADDAAAGWLDSERLYIERNVPRRRREGSCAAAAAPRGSGRKLVRDGAAEARLRAAPAHGERDCLNVLFNR